MKKLIFLTFAFVLIITCGTTVSAQTESYDQYENVHPRIIMDDDKFMRAKEFSEGELKHVWSAFTQELDSYLSDGPTEYYVNSNTEETWMNETAQVIMKMSLAYKISGREDYKNGAALFFNAAQSYPSWGRDKFENCSLAAANMLIAISCYYDWLYDELSYEEKEAIAGLIYERGAVMEQKAWGSRKYLSNLAWVPASSMAVSAAAIYDIYPEAKKWFDTSNKWFSRTFYYLNTEGTYQEGPLYWDYALTHMIYYIEMAEKFCGIDYKSHGFLTGTADYGIYTRMPPLGSSEGQIIGVFNFGDCPQTTSLSWVSNMAYLAQLNSNPVIEHYVKLGINNPSARHCKEMWQLFMYYNPKCEPQMPSHQNGYPLNKYFEQLGYVFLRSGWSGNESVVSFRCGPTLGTLGRKKFAEAKLDDSYNIGLTHSHADIASFMLFANNEYLIVDDGYAKGDTWGHNTLTVNGKGQYEGDDEGYSVNAASIANPQIIKFEENDNYVYVVADAKESYMEKYGVEKYLRHFIYVGGDVLIVFDDAKTRERNNLEVRFYPKAQTGINTEDRSYTFESDNSLLSIKELGDENINVALTAAEGGRTSLCMQTYSDKLCLPTAISWSAKGELPRKIRLIKEENNVLWFGISSKADDGELIIILDAKEKQVYSARLPDDSVMYSRIDYSNHTLNYAGIADAGTDVPVKITDSNGKIIYIGYDTADEDGVFSSAVRLKNLDDGVYNVYTYNPVTGKPCVSFVYNNKENTEKLSVSGYIQNTAPGYVSGEVNVGNNAEENMEFTMYLAFYTSDARLCAIIPYKTGVLAGSYKNIPFTDINRNNAHTIRAFFWDEAMLPLTAELELG